MEQAPLDSTDVIIAGGGLVGLALAAAQLAGAPRLRVRAARDRLRSGGGHQAQVHLPGRLEDERLVLLELRVGELGVAAAYARPPPLSFLAPASRLGHLDSVLCALLVQPGRAAGRGVRPNGSPSAGLA